jgi:hypothetical protein
VASSFARGRRCSRWETPRSQGKDRIESRAVRLDRKARWCHDSQYAENAENIKIITIKNFIFTIDT